MVIHNGRVDNEIKNPIFDNLESMNEKNESEMKMLNSKMNHGFQNAMDDYFNGSRDPKIFVQILRSAGFRDDWTSSERETAVARIAIKYKYRMWGKPEAQAEAQSILDTLITVYHSGCDQQKP